MGENVYQPIRAELLEVRQETPTIKTFRLAPDEPVPFRAGQFVQLTMPGIGEAFRLPALPVYGMGAALGLGFGIWVYRGHGLWGTVLACGSFLLPVFWFSYSWYNG